MRGSLFSGPPLTTTLLAPIEVRPVNAVCTCAAVDAKLNAAVVSVPNVSVKVPLVKVAAGASS